MPLTKSKSKAAFSANVSAEMHAGKPQKQALAIAYDVQRRARRAVGGVAPEAQGGWWERNQQDPVQGYGLVPGDTGGRADALKLSVPAGSYVIPADVVSAHGAGNTQNGAKNLDRLFGDKAQGFAAGGGAPQPSPLVPVALSGGEFVVDPPRVAAIGHGDIDYGHDILDEFVKHSRDQHVKTLKKLPGPVR